MKSSMILRISFQLIVISLACLCFMPLLHADEPGIAVNLSTSKGSILSNIKVYAFTGPGSYTGMNATTDANGTAAFDSAGFDSGDYKFRADYMGNRFWSPIIPMPGTSIIDIIIDEESAGVNVIASSGPSQGGRVYLFSGAGSYLGLYRNTDAGGNVFFDLPVEREFRFRADIMGNQYWSDIATIQPGGTNHIDINAGGGNLQVTVDNGSGMPMQGIKTYLFSTSGSYLGVFQTTGTSGVVNFNVPEGTYKVRADYLGNRFWSDDTLVTEDVNISLPAMVKIGN